MSTRYEIVVAGEAGPMLLAALDGFEVQPSAPGSVRLTGAVQDQPALVGAIDRLHDLRVEVIEVRRLDS